MKATTLKQIIASLLLSLCAAHFAGALEPARTTAPAGPYHAGRLNFTTPGGQAVNLFIQFRDGRALASHVLENGKLHSPKGDAPNVVLDNVETLRFDGAKLQGDWKWAPRGAVETIPFDATVRDGIVTGKAGQADLTGWLRSEQQMAQVNGLAPERDWPSRTGPRGDWSGIDTGAKLTTDFSKSLMVWFSEAEFGGGRETRQCPVRWLSGTWSPIVGEGRIFFIHQQPAGEIVDDAALKYTQGLLDKLLARPNVLLDPAVRRAKERGAAHFARVDGDDVIVCVDGASGKTVWETVLPGRSFNTAPYNKHADQTRTGCYGDGKVFMLGRTFRLYACDAKTGKLLWESALPKIHEETEADKLKALANRKQFGMEEYPPLHFADGVVFAATLKDEVAGFDAATGKLLWTTPGSTPGLWKHEGVARVLVTRAATSTGGGNIACVDLKTGKELWTAPVEGMRKPAEGPELHLRLLGSYLVTRYVGKTDAHYLVGYKVEPTGLKQLWKQTDEKRFLHRDNPMTMHKGLFYTKLNGAAGMSLVAMEPETGKIVAQADIGNAGSGRNGVLIVNDGLAIVQKDGSHPSGGQGPDNVQVYRLPDLAPVGAILQTHNTTSGYDTPMAWQYVDGRLIIRGCNRIACYDLRQTPSLARVEEALSPVRGNPSAVMDALDRLMRDEDPAVRAAAGREMALHAARGEWGDRQRVVLSHLGGLLGASQQNVRSAAVAAMPALGREAVPLIAAAMDGPDPVARLSAMQAAKELGGRKDAAGLEQVIGRGLRDTDAAVVLAALDAAGARGEPAQVLSPRLIELAGSKVDAVQASAVQALLLLHPDGKFPFDQLPDAKSRVVAYLGVHPYAPVVSSALAAINSLGDKEALRIYSGILEGNDALMAARACHGLAAMGEAGRPAVPLIEAALKRWSNRVFVTSAEDALRRLRETSK